MDSRETTLTKWKSTTPFLFLTVVSWTNDFVLGVSDSSTVK